MFRKMTSALKSPVRRTQLDRRQQSESELLRAAAELIAEQGDMTLVEVQARLIERGTLVGIGTVHRFFVRHGITRKKRPGTRSSKIVPTS